MVEQGYTVAARSWPMQRISHVFRGITCPSLPGSRGIAQDVAGTPDRRDVVGTRRFDDFLAQLADKHVDDLGRRLVAAVGSVEMGHERLLADDLVPALRQYLDD